MPINVLSCQKLEKNWILIFWLLIHYENLICFVCWFANSQYYLLFRNPPSPFQIVHVTIGWNFLQCRGFRYRMWAAEFSLSILVSLMSIPKKNSFSFLSHLKHTCSSSILIWAISYAKYMVNIWFLCLSPSLPPSFLPLSLPSSRSLSPSVCEQLPVGARNVVGSLELAL